MGCAPLPVCESLPENATALVRCHSPLYQQCNVPPEQLLHFIRAERSWHLANGFTAHAETN